jgi:hypothetical protein
MTRSLPLDPKSSTSERSPHHLDIAVAHALGTCAHDSVKALQGAATGQQWSARPCVQVNKTAMRHSAAGNLTGSHK